MFCAIFFSTHMALNNLYLSISNLLLLIHLYVLIAIKITHVAKLTKTLSFIIFRINNRRFECDL